jgi:hypothetical protein
MQRMDSKISSLSSLSEVGAVIRGARMPVYRLEAGKDVSLASLLAMLAPLGLALSLDPREPGPLRAADLAKAFAHLQEPDET